MDKQTNYVSVTLIVGGIILAVCGVSGWYWLILIGLICD